MRKIGKYIDTINAQYRDGSLTLEEAISKLVPVAESMNRKRKGERLFTAGRLLK